MARLPYPEAEALPDQVGRALGRLPELNIFRMLAHAEASFVPFLRYSGTLWQASSLTEVQRELAILAVAELTGARYEWVQHVPIAHAVGIGDDRIEAVRRRSWSDPALSPDERTLLALAVSATTGGRLDDEAFARGQALLGARGVVELHLLVGLYRTLASLMLELDIEIDLPQPDAMIDLNRR